MTESIAASDFPSDKSERYASIHASINSIVSGEPNRIARYATATSLLVQAFSPRFFWTGFYIVDAFKPTELVVGPYQGTLGCLRIPFGRGVCGVAAMTGRTQLVDDVHAFPDHIACDSRSASEIVVPVFDASGALAAVLDIDSTSLAAFDDVDRNCLEAICADLLTLP